MTFREFYGFVIEQFGADSEVGAFAQTQVEKMDTRLATRKATISPTQQAAAAFAAEVLAAMEPGVTYTAMEIGEKFGVKPQKATAALRKLVAAGSVEQSEVKIKACKAEGIQGGTFKGYTLVATEVEGE